MVMGRYINTASMGMNGKTIGASRKVTRSAKVITADPLSGIYTRFQSHPFNIC